MSTIEFDRLGYFSPSIRNMNRELQYARYADRHGFDTVWKGESRLARDALTVLGAFTQVTDDITLATGVTNNWTRNVALMAQSWSTLYELAGPRLKLGIGAWWEPLASKVGVDRRKPLRALWEYCTVVDRLLKLENVTYDGEVVRVEDIELDIVHDAAEPRDIPIYIGATGPTANKMSGELAALGIADGVLMNYLLPPEHNQRVLEKQREGAEKQGGSLDDVDRPQLIGVSLADDTDEAIDEARGLVTQYIGQQPHIREASGIDSDLADEISAELGGWPADADDVARAKALVPDDVVRNVVAAGTPDEVVERVWDYCETGCTEPVLHAICGNVEWMIDVFSEYRVE
jgi:alkanesulfonate monooxygenase SsuD/methylene tetrahydromethanopterin reductase-like flavin-dependent oxidoreductase (luciferase family)